jgi:hypothetical protein
LKPESGEPIVLSHNSKAYKDRFKKTTSKIGEYKSMLVNNEFEPDKALNAGKVGNGRAK